jgi:asparagine synthase (glutamine-hydrolysing)
MCGIAGFAGPPDHDVLVAMADVLVHRGPDDEGYFETPEASLGFRRLSIIDLENGHQPMSNPAGDVHIVFNGELYNYRELRGQLVEQGHRFATESDAEVLLRSYEAWGSDCFSRFNGMWAVAILDQRHDEPCLLLARDHFGIKPLYLARVGERLCFASEIKALLAVPGLVPQVDERRLAEYLLRGLHDHDERTFFEGVTQVMPATYVTVDTAGRTASVRYWVPRLSEDAAAADPAGFRQAFKKAVERRLVADVTVGTCLSGGLDSSTIVCMMTELLEERAPDAHSMGDRLRTFSAVFDGDPIDEQDYIKTVLKASGAASEFVRPVSPDLFRDLPLLIWHQDEPIVSSGPYAQYRVMELAAGKAKVLLDGQAGDELLAGYVPYQYVYLRQLLKQRDWRLFANEALAARDVLWPLVRRKLADRGGRALDVQSLLAGDLATPDTRREVAKADVRSRDDLKLRLLQDLTQYSLPSLLRYEDRNSMAHSIESRVPFLDQELVELVLSLPPDAIIHRGWSRIILRDAMRGTLPDKVRLRRKKIGFTTPEMRWLRAQRAEVQGIFRSPSFAARPWWDGPAIARAFAACCEGTVEESSLFWRVLDIEGWMRVFHGADPLAPGGRRPAAGERVLADAGDAEAARLAGTKAALRLHEIALPNAAKHLFMSGSDGRSIFARVPVRTARVEEGDDVELVIADALAEACGGRLGPLEPDDIVAVSEKAVAISQGRSFPVKSIAAGRLATVLARFVKKGPAGIGLGMPETMQLAIDEAGAPRIVAAAAVGAAARVVGRRGTFYRVAGSSVSAIDGPTAGTLPPYDTHAKLPPSDPDGVAASLSLRLSKEAGGTVHAVVIDANDRGAVVLGASEGVDRDEIRWLFGDNPLGQGAEQTPVALIRRIGAG